MEKDERKKHKKHGFGGGSLPLDETKGERVGGFRVDDEPAVQAPATEPVGEGK